MMKTSTKKIFFIFTLVLLTGQVYASFGCLSSPKIPCINCNHDDPCCGKMGGISYCDSSSGRYVCNNGFNSSCYCTRHAVMDLQHLQGCCLWQGGMLQTTPEGIVLCRDGTASIVCSMLKNDEKVSVY